MEAAAAAFDADTTAETPDFQKPAAFVGHRFGNGCFNSLVNSGSDFWGPAMSFDWKAYPICSEREGYTRGTCDADRAEMIAEGERLQALNEKLCLDVDWWKRNFDESEAEIERLREALEKIAKTAERAHHVPLERLGDIRMLARATLAMSTKPENINTSERHVDAVNKPELVTEHVVTSLVTSEPFTAVKVDEHKAKP